MSPCGKKKKNKVICLDENKDIKFLPRYLVVPTNKNLNEPIKKHKGPAKITYFFSPFIRILMNL